MMKRWEIKVPDPSLRDTLVSSLHLHPVTAQLLLHRGVRSASEARTFLSHDLSACPDPFLLKDMDKAVYRLKRALKKKETILVWGDYDVDGVTSSTLLVRSLRALGFQALCHIPNRLTDGYGLNKAFFALTKKSGPHIVISADTGIAGHETVDYLRDLGIDVILTDHHQPKDELPKAHAIINPHQKECPYPFKFLSGVGISYKLACALAGSLSSAQQEKIQTHLDLVAVGTVADVVPMIGENRILVYHGLRQLEKREKPGFRALLAMGRIQRQRLSPKDVVFVIGPRINASGRLGSAETALNLLLTDHEDQAREFARTLEAGNRARRRIEKDMLREAILKVEREVNFKYERVIVLQDEKWHPGVVGIIASRILNRFYRPTIVIATSGGIGRGSARSIQGFSLLSALDQCKEFLDEFGGHPFACGLTLRKEHIQPFRESLNRVASKLLDVEDLVPTLSIDMELPVQTLTLSLLEELEQLAPFGPGNPEPLFLSKGLLLRGVFQKGKERRLDFREEEKDASALYEVVISTSLAKELNPFLDQPVDVVYHPFLKREDPKRIVLSVRDFSPSKVPSSG